jgi:DNA-binding transcriptional ArsR family regulator
VDHDALADLLRALAHPIRVAVVERLDEIGELNPRAFADASGVSLATASHHFRVLASTGLIELVRTEPRRGAVEHFYALSARGRGASGWLQTAPR